MFESASFLYSYLPVYFKKMFLQRKGTYSDFDPKLLEDVAEFLVMSKKLFVGSHCESLLTDFLICSFLAKSSGIYTQILSQNETVNLGSFILSDYGKGNYLALQSLVLYLCIDLRVKAVLNEATSSLNSDQLYNKLKRQELSMMQKLRFEVEALSYFMASEQQKQKSYSYEKCMQKIINLLLEKWGIDNKTQQILVSILQEEEVNLSDKKKLEIISKLKENKEKKETQINCLQKNPGIISKLNKEHQNEKQNQSSKKKQNPLFEILKTKKHPTPRKTPVFGHRPHLVQKNISDYTVSHKHKPIMKFRTIHQSRKNVFIPKNNENSITFYTEKFEPNTQNSIDFSNVGSQNTYQYADFSENWNCDDENLLVRSTPKQIRHTRRFNAISKKLDFSLEGNYF